jgi:regulator of protease activity HflC (stomatin/prohibitin superfamily)
MVLRNFLDFIVPISWALIVIGGIAYLLLVRRRYGLPAALRRLFSYRVLVPLLILFVISFISAGMKFIDPREVGVVISLFEDRGVRERPVKSGLHWVWPIFEEVVRYPVVMQSYTMAGRPTEGDKLGDDAIRARTSDGQLVIIDTTMLFQIDADLAVDLHILWQDRYIQDFIRPGLRAFVRSQASKFTVDEINSHKRKAFEDAVNELAKAHCQGTGIQPHVILVRNITFSPEYATSVEEKMTALQRVTEAEYKAKQVANMAKGEAEQIKIRARAEADAIRVTASAEADAHVVKAEAEAKALELIAQSLEQRDNLLTYRYIDKLSPNIKAMLLPSNAPLILPMPELGQEPQAAALPASTVTPPLKPEPLPAPPVTDDKPLLVDQIAPGKSAVSPAALRAQ